MTNRPNTTRPARRARFALALVGAAAVALTACNAASMFDVVGLEGELTAELGEAYEADGFTLFGVDCPRRAADATSKDVFACVAEVERQFVRVRVEVTDRSGGYDWSTLDVVHDLDTTEPLVAAEMSEALRDEISLDCGSPRIRVLPIGASILCEATDSGRNVVQALLHVNGAGQTGWEVLG